MTIRKILSYSLIGIFFFIVFVLSVKRDTPDYIKKREQKLDRWEQKLDDREKQLGETIIPDTVQVMMIEGSRYYKSVNIFNNTKIDPDDTVSYKSYKYKNYTIKRKDRSCYFTIYQVKLGGAYQFFMVVSGYKPKEHPDYIEYVNSINKSNENRKLSGELRELY